MRALLLVYAACCAALAAAVYAVGLGTPGGRAFDAASLGPHGGPGSQPVRAASVAVVHTIDVGSLVLLGGGLVAIALLRRRLDVAVAAAALILGANVTTQILKPALGRWDPLGGDAVRGFASSFPSGHATVAMSLAAALVLAAPPALKSPAALAGAAYAAAVGVSLMVQRWHYASDVAGGYLVVGAWAGLVAALSPLRPTGTRRASLRLGAALAALLVAAFGVLLAVAVHRHPHVLVHVHVHTRFVVAAAGLCALAVCVAGALSALLQAAALRRY